MTIADIHSHLNGKEYLAVHHPKLWQEIEHIVQAPIGSSKGVGTTEAPRQDVGVELADAICNGLVRQGWLPLGSRGRECQHDRSPSPGEPEDPTAHSIRSVTSDSLIKGRVGVTVHLGSAQSVGIEGFAQHLALYVGDVIDVGVEILPMKELQSEMSSGVAYYEGELYNVLRQGRGVPAVPLVLVGIAP